ncbi:MAG: DEAD/DEAH box helicase [Gammaproteobacteria bacterium]|nr:DEAD/DEAH box helicase [Gammaproteobacteria bacterium]
MCADSTSDELFHPAVGAWFAANFAAPTAVQRRAWPAIQARRHTLLAAPTGSGKTLAAFLAAIDQLVRDGEVFGLPDETRILYVSPLKALSNDIHKNLEVPLAGIRERLDPLSPLEVRAAVRTGDTPATERARMRRAPPHILVTTPESLFIVLTSESGRDMLSAVRTVIIDELHAVADNKRGAHLALSLERLAALCPEPLTRVGISATQKPMTAMVEFLLGNRPDACEVVDTGYVRERDIALELPGSPLQPLMAGEVWTEVYDRLAALVREHRSTLVFVNTRRLAERAARHLAERLDETRVTAHHGSLSREHRLDAEQRLKTGKLDVLVATASLELGIDIGDIDLVCQLGSPRGIAPLLQRVGRSGHGVDALPKGRLFPLSRDDLVECTALLDAVTRQELDAICLQGPALDVLAQQIVAEVAARECSIDELFGLIQRARPYRELSREQFDAIVAMLGAGFSTRFGRRAAYLHVDTVNGRLRARRGARLVAMTNGGAIPDQFDYDVVLMPEELPVGSLNEDFAFESLPGDIFQLGNMSYRILQVTTGKVYVEDARGAPPTIPFWFGEAPGRTDELSVAVSRLRAGFSAQMESGGTVAARAWLEADLDVTPAAAEQLTDYLGAAHLALDGLPTQDRIVLERFFDELGDTHLIVHSPLGSRLNRAWGLALRKRFCRKFNFELQAAALEDSIVLSLGPTHSFPLDEVSRYLHPNSLRHVLTQALLTAPVFPTRWRWAATTALAVRRNRNGKKVPPQFQRSNAEDLLAVIFPDQLACAENLAGEREVPDHPLVQQTLDDCLHELMDVAGLERLIARIIAGDVEVVAKDLTSPSPLSQEIINAKPYAFLDDAPAEERRTQAIRSRHLMDPEDAAQLARLDPAAIDAVCAEALPLVRDADELHDALALSGFLTADECRQPGWDAWMDALIGARRATRVTVAGGQLLWVSAERLPQLASVLADCSLAPPLPLPAELPSPDASRVELIRSRLETLGPITATALAAPLSISRDDVRNALQALESEGFVMQGSYRGGDEVEWCERRLLARIHRRSLDDLRRQIEPVSPAALMRFLFRWHGLTGERLEGPDGVRIALEKLQGFAAPAALWEKALLPQRVDAYLPSDLDHCVTSGAFAWLRPACVASSGSRPGPVRNTPMTLLARDLLDAWPGPRGDRGPEIIAGLSVKARRVYESLERDGALFFSDLVRATGIMRTEVENALAELVGNGLVTADSYAGLRALIAPASRKASFSRARRRGGLSVDAAGRWSLLAPPPADTEDILADDAIERIAWVLLQRYGIVIRVILQRESRRLPPWRQLVRVLRRMEARGEVRGGRFVNGFGGEQFALPDAVDGLRRARDGDQDLDVAIAAADPLNLTGITTPGERVPATSRNRVLYHGGCPVAVFAGGDFRWLVEPDPAAEWSARNLLVRHDPRVTYVPGAGQPDH